MKKSMKGIMSLLLAFILCFSLCPLSDIEEISFCFLKAEAIAEDENIVITDKIKLSAVADLETPTRYFASSSNSVVYSGSYGNQLKGNAKGIYSALIKQYGENRAYQSFEIKLSEPITFVLEVSGNKIIKNDVYNKAVQNITADIQNAVDAFFYDRADVFWIKSGQYEYYVSAQGSAEKGYTGVIDSVTYIPATVHAKEISDYDNAVKNAVSEIKKNISYENDKYETLKAIHDYICENSYYKLSVLDSSVHTSYPFFLGDGGMVCDGYAKTFKVLCDAFDIECACIGGYAYTSSGGEGHMWNYVQMEDKRWYLVDVTWNDDSNISYTYFLASANSEGYYAPLDEERYEIATFSDAGYMEFVYPVLSTKTYQRHYHSWESDYTVDKKPTCTEKGVKSIHCSNCDAAKSKTSIAAKGHSFLLSEKTKATYTVKATETYTCSVCNKVKVKTLDYKTLGKANTLKVSNVTDKSVKLTWSKVTGAKKYVLYYKCQGESWQKVGTTKCSYTLSNLKSGKAYSFKVRAVAGDNRAECGKEVSCTLCPAKVGKITFTQSETAIKLTWSKVTGATGYKVYMYNSKSKKWERIATTSDASYKVKNLSTGVSYKFKVKAFIKKDGKTLWGEMSDAYKTATKPAKTAIKSLSAKKEAFLIKWKEVKGVSGYIVEYSLTKDFAKKTKILVKGQESLKKTVKGLKSGKTYYVKIRTYKTSGGVRIYGSSSEIKKVTVK